MIRFTRDAELPEAQRATESSSVEATLLELAVPADASLRLLHVRNTLPLAERLHRALVRRAAKGRRIDCPELTGRHVSGRPLESGHRHAHVLPLDLDGDQRLDHVLIWAPMGLGPVAQSAVRSLRWLGNPGDRDGLRVAVVGQGNWHALRCLPEPLQRSTRLLLGAEVGRQQQRMRGGPVSAENSRLAHQPASDEAAAERWTVSSFPGRSASILCGRVVSIDGTSTVSSVASIDGVTSVERVASVGGIATVGGARVWSSMTPFVPPRYVKPRGKNSLEGQVQAELASRGLPEASSVEVLEGLTSAMRSFVRVRRGGRRPPVDMGYALRIELIRPVFGPITLGYAGHFGLGLFRAEVGVGGWGLGAGGAALPAFSV